MLRLMDGREFKLENVDDGFGLDELSGAQRLEAKHTKYFITEFD